MKILVMSCDKNSDLFEPFYHFMEKYWPDHPEIFYSTETIDNPYYTTIKLNYPVSVWTKRLRETIEQIDDNFILLMCDDIFIRKNVNNTAIEQLVTYFDSNTASLNLEQTFDSRDTKIDDLIMVRSASGKYKTSVMCNLYKKEKLLNILKNFDVDPWTFETTNKHLNYRYLVTTKGQLLDWGWNTRHWFGVKAGKWCREALEFFKKENFLVDSSKRGVYGEVSKAVICALAKNENQYIDNWINYHLGIGFTHIYIFDNNEPDAPPLIDCITQKDKVTIIDKKGVHKQSFQIGCYNEFYSKYKNDFDWCAFIDVDEFISGVYDVKSWLTKLNAFESVRIKWKMFGDDNEIDRDRSIPVQKYFRYPLKNNISDNGKCIVKGGLKDLIIGSCHYAFRCDGTYIEGIGGDRNKIVLPKQCLPSGAPCKSKITILEDYSKESIYLNHYMTKTLAEFIDQKLGRGDAIFAKRAIDFDYYWRINKKTPEKLAYIDKRLKQAEQVKPSSKPEPAVIAKPVEPRSDINIDTSEGIDIVIPYVDSSDPNWQRLFTLYNPITGRTEEINGINRFRGQGTFFKYVFRSIEKNTPWIRKIHLVVQSESQVPSWINQDRVHVVLHKDFIPEEYLPVFNSTAIEMFIWNIPGLSERFIYSNDDIYFYNKLTPNHFFDGKFCRNDIKPCGFGPGSEMYTHHCKNAYCLVYDLETASKINSFSHIARPYLKSLVKECFDKYEKQILASISRFRDYKNINMYVYDNYILKQGFQRPRQDLSFSNITQKSCDYYTLKYVLGCKSPIKITCINDVSDTNIYENMSIRNYFNEKFPSKSKYER